MPTTEELLKAAKEMALIIASRHAQAHIRVVGGQQQKGAPLQIGKPSENRYYTPF